jgi:hypothetical protein
MKKKLIYIFVILVISLFVISSCNNKLSNYNNSNSILSKYENIGAVFEGTIVKESEAFYFIEELTKEKFVLYYKEDDVYPDSPIRSLVLEDFGHNCNYCKPGIPNKFPIHAIVSGEYMIVDDQKIILIRRQYGYAFVVEIQDVLNPLDAVELAEDALKEQFIIDGSEREINLTVKQIVLSNTKWRFDDELGVDVWEIEFEYMPNYPSKSVYVSLKDGKIKGIFDNYPMLTNG